MRWNVLDVAQSSSIKRTHGLRFTAAMSNKVSVYVRVVVANMEDIVSAKLRRRLYEV